MEFLFINIVQITGIPGTYNLIEIMPSRKSRSDRETRDLVERAGFRKIVTTKKNINNRA